MSKAADIEYCLKLDESEICYLLSFRAKFNLTNWSSRLYTKIRLRETETFHTKWIHSKKVDFNFQLQNMYV